MFLASLLVSYTVLTEPSMRDARQNAVIEACDHFYQTSDKAISFEEALAEALKVYE